MKTYRAILFDLGWTLVDLPNQPKIKEEFVPYPETIDTLKTLKARGFLIGVISNAPPLSPATIAQMRIADYIDAWTFSYELGIEKPDPRIFHAALAKLGVTADEALMVGDSLDNDVLGARAAGIDAIQIVREGTVSDEREQIGGLDELLQRL